ncbi:MAG: hypothetical protein QM765_34950 [Myxococcales bacterium]
MDRLRLGHLGGAGGGQRHRAQVQGQLGGIEYAHFMGGIDLQLDSELGLGFFIDYAIGEYFIGKREVNGVVQFDDSFRQRGVHTWLQVGPRLAF